MGKATYISSGHGRSRNAEIAESQGKLPMTRAVAVLREAIPGMKVNAAKVALEAVWDGEWHHTGKYAKVTNYYDVEEAYKLIVESKRPDADDRKRIFEMLDSIGSRDYISRRVYSNRGSGMPVFKLAISEVSEETGLPKDIIEDHYYRS